jgi:hypothetical protein
MFGLVYSYLAFPILPRWVYSKTRQQETDAKSNCVGEVILRFGVKRLSRGQEGTRYRLLLFFFFFLQGSCCPKFSVILQGGLPRSQPMSSALAIPEGNRAKGPSETKEGEEDTSRVQL